MVGDGNAEGGMDLCGGKVKACGIISKYPEIIRLRIVETVQLDSSYDERNQK